MSFAVGIDLGTTHTVVALARVDRDEPPIILPISQHVAPKEVESLSLLPSALYLPLDGECSESRWVVGRWAQARAEALPERGIMSPKSWLAHSGVDRASQILPWGSDGERLSPLGASRLILAQAHASLAALSLAKDAPVVVTIPASFDPMARELTLEAAQSVFGTVTLVDEPVAAFFALSGERRSALRDRAAQERRALLVLVCDVGGGTSDFCLLSVASDGPLERVATGRHLLLGGDNIDLALTHLVEQKLAIALEPAELRALVSSCRDAKERILSGSATAQVAIARRSSKLVGATLRAELTHAEVTACVHEGFFPRVAFDEAPARARHALSALGLPYERDPAITRHLALFLRSHLPPEARVDAVLFNGGTMTPVSVRERILESLQGWFGATPDTLSHHSLDRAVALGAAEHARRLATRERPIRIRAPRSYYLDVGGGSAVAILARGTIDNAAQRVATSGLHARLGTKVRIDLYAADGSQVDEPGTIVRVADLERVSRLTTVLTGTSSGEVPIALSSMIDESGRIAVTVQHLDHHFALAFELDGSRDETVSEIPRHTRTEDAVMLVEAAFGKSQPMANDRSAKDLVRNLEATLGDRATWNVTTLRAIGDALGKRGGARRRSPEHERVFWLVAGYCIRPGYGYSEDVLRVASLTARVADRLAFPTEARGWQQLLTAMRRMAAGATAETQTEWFSWLAPFVAPLGAGLKKPKKGHPVSSETELLALLSSLERLPLEVRATLAEWLLERALVDSDVRIWQAITRIGLRELIYTDASRVLPRAEIERWLSQLLREPWDETRARAGALLARRTGDRVRDVDEGTRSRVRAKLQAGFPKGVALLDEPHAEKSDQDAWGGDTLPVGLVLDKGPQLYPVSS